MDRKVLIHFILENKIRMKVSANFVPRLGEEVRMSDNEFYEVGQVVWAMDEPDALYERVNIGLRKAD